MKKYFILFILCGFSYFAGAQSPAETFKQAEALRLDYQFEAAVAIFSKIAAQGNDTLAKIAAQHLLFCENAQILLRYAEKPMVTGRISVPKTIFFNYYDINFGGDWALVPDSLRQAAQNRNTLSPVFIPSDGASVIYFSSIVEGHWNIYTMRHVEGNQWTSPLALDSTINTSFDEFYPYATPDGKTLYFSSNGHSGMGGYDLYKSTFNEATQQWNTPENLGFPYSSPYDDWLFVPNVEQTTALFASSRQSKADSLTIYRIVLEANPFKQSVRTVQEVRQIAQLVPITNKALETKIDTSGEKTSSDEYNSLRKLLLRQQKQEQLLQTELASTRRLYAAANNDDELNSLLTKILESEQQLSNLRSSIAQTGTQIQQAEQQLLEKGIVPEIKEPEAVPDQAVDIAPFTLRYKPSVPFPAISVLPPPEEIITESEYVFKIAKTSTIIYNQPVVSGLIYRIQIGMFSRKLPNAELKGLSPVFIYPDKNLFIHYIGQVGIYSEATKILQEIKKRGFKEAVIVSFLDGKKITVKIAREQELKKKSGTVSRSPQLAPVYYKIILGEYPDGLPQALKVAVQAGTENDIVKTSSKGRMVYVVGPFPALADAQKLQGYLRANGFETTIE